MKKLSIFFFILFMIHLLSCTEVVQNKSGDSELTLLMREMFDDGMNIKQQILEGKNPEIFDKAERLLSSHSTDPKTALSEDYKLFAQSYLASLEALREADSENINTQYEIVITSCMNCHQKLCPGPMMKIKKLYIN